MLRQLAPLIHAADLADVAKNGRGAHSADRLQMTPADHRHSRGLGHWEN
jgi:hypothetical protein